MDHRAIDAIRPTGAANDLPDGTRALLMVEVDGAEQDLPRQIAALQQALEGDGPSKKGKKFSCVTQFLKSISSGDIHPGHQKAAD